MIQLDINESRQTIEPGSIHELVSYVRGVVPPDEVICSLCVNGREIPEADLARIAADYAFGLSSNHPFRDGNRRIAFLAAVIFLGLNGLAVVATDDEVVEKMIALASGKVDEDELAEWIRSRTQMVKG